MLTIRLTPIGKKHQRHYRIVVMPARSKLTGIPIATLGTPDKYDAKALADWITKGAQPSLKIREICKIS
ncbi:MAG: hypothetical protein UX80_C0009G0051 [Candidatus Amesbacteria bacterium GW2011_GWA2_47_11b]|uniref:30S ribosomal protein S16 n=2 Tax=Candidatus Amesiibacteriota TaxID=1752730 RepID=A0A0G1SDS1_9BACT|nr:MAG: hypothetical protein UX42_C0006G0009 [Microgenomates group bacterium GW2011_GWC1_46_20]KKU57836.1 MAG: hypothetical protein UX80_C0009G0051 [Candidatus Amesbacteria bacterium GW2011_GWA2_47_11b]KKU67581.1 MAG: hypothetical protein UX92_C0030G0009 [Candidatus Amesbacteria bacterium GW2011_GWA1_47_20]